MTKIGSVRYPGEIIRRNKPFSLKLMPRRKLPSPYGVFVTQAAVKQVGGLGGIYEVTKAAVKLDGGSADLHRIFVRYAYTTNMRRAATIFLAEAELEQLSGYFGPPLNVLDEAFFITPQRIMAGLLLLEINEAELLNPKWRVEYRSWTGGEGALPRPSEFTWYFYQQAQPGQPGRITLPDFPQVMMFNGAANAPSTSRIVLTEKGQVRRISFQTADEVVYFTPRMSKGEVVPERGKMPLAEDERYEPGFFNQLLQSGKSDQYSFSKRARKDGAVSLGNIGGISTHIVSKTGEHFKPDVLYYFKVIKTSDSLIIECYSDAEHKECIGVSNPVRIEYNSLRYSYFHIYPPKPQVVTCIGDLEMPGAQKKKSWNPLKFLSLFGLKPQSLEYITTFKARRKKWLDLCVVKGKAYKIRCEDFEAGQEYHFRFTRKGLSFTVEAYWDPEREDLIAKRTVDLNREGELRAGVIDLDME